MGQAILDLPDPSQSAAPISSADDLLSQLAGQEIDRLLADAEQNMDAPPASSVHELTALDDEVERLEKLVTQDELKKAAEEAAKAAAAPVKRPTGTKEAYAEQVGKLLNVLNIVPEKPTIEVAEPQSVTSSGEESTSAAERQALAPDNSESSEEPVVTMQQVLDEATGRTPIPLYLRGLELLNLPFSFCPDEIRDTLGKVAILTMMNSAGVLLYVLMFRKH